MTVEMIFDRWTNDSGDFLYSIELYSEGLHREIFDTDLDDLFAVALLLLSKEQEGCLDYNIEPECAQKVESWGYEWQKKDIRIENTIFSVEAYPQKPLDALLQEAHEWSNRVKNLY